MLRTVPVELRPALLELIAVSNGLKPVMRVTARAPQVQVLTSWLIQRNFKILLRRQEVDSSTFAQIAPAYRHVEGGVLWQIFIARTEDAINAMAVALRSPSSYVDIGLALGYPECCVTWAAKADRVDHDGRAVRQTNLIAAAMERTRLFLAECNCLLRDCSSAEFPTSAISHYPCRFDCAESVALANTYMNCLDNESSDASMYLRRLLRMPQLWWSDANWSIDFANEFPGMILDKDHSDLTGSARFAALSNVSATPGGKIPQEGLLQELGATRLLLWSEKTPHSIDLIASGTPRLLVWS